MIHKILNAITRQRVKYNFELMFGKDWNQNTSIKREGFKR